MSQAPSMPMFWDAYIADTTHLTTEEHGAYLLLLAAMWRRNGWVPDDDRDNARILGLTPAKWKRIKARLSEFLVFEDGHITQKNLLKIWEITQEKIKKNRENGAKGGRPKSTKNKDLAKANGSVADNPSETIPEPEPEPDISKSSNELLPVSGDAIHANEVSAAVSAYNEIAARVGWPTVQKMTPARSKSLRARLRECGGLDGWRAALDRAHASDFCRESWNGFGFDSLISQKKFTRLMEGNYDNRTGSSQGAAGFSGNRRGSSMASIIARRRAQGEN